jgi:CBS domain-containing protein
MRNQYDPESGGYYRDRIDRDERPSGVIPRREEYGLDRPNWGSARSDYGRNAYGGRLDERGLERHQRRTEERDFFDRAGDEVRTWFGDEGAERRRRMDEWTDEKRQHAEQLRRTRWPDEMRVHHLMTQKVACISPYDSIAQAARLMRECDCGALPVLDRGGRLVGMITDRDIAVRLVAQGVDTRQARVAHAMTGEAFACHVDDTLEECMRHMSRHQVRRLPVLDDRNRIVGMISLGDLAQHASEHPGWGERRAITDMLCAVSESTSRAHR